MTTPKALLKKTLDWFESKEPYTTFVGEPYMDAHTRIEKLTRELIDEIKDHLSPPPKRKADPVATALATNLLESMSRASKTKLTSSVSSSAKPIEKLLKKGVTEKQVLDTVTWLEKENPKRQYPFVVLSGQSLLDKWDKIQVAMKTPTEKKPVEKPNYGW